MFKTWDFGMVETESVKIKNKFKFKKKINS